MTFKLTNQEGQRLTACLLAMRPDWTKNNPGQLLADANTDGLPGHDFGHALRALATYCTAVDSSGSWQYRTPNLFIQDGKYWTTTAPADWVRARPSECEVHLGESGPTCRCCIADVKLGDRPESHIGKHWAPADVGAFDIQGET